jgi:adenosylhomocysteine nucleosidase
MELDHVELDQATEQPQAATVNTVVLLTALNLEYQAIRRHLDQTWVRLHPAGTIFEVGQLRGIPGTVVLAVTGEGNVGAAVLAERAIAMFRPRALLCVGVAGGLKDDITLGDVVVATKIYALHGGRDQSDGFLTRPKAWQASHELEQVARHVARSGAWTGLLAPAPESAPPMVHFKPIASGEVVLCAADTPLATRLRDSYDDAVAVEMESAGVAQAAHLNRSVPVLSVRGISDRADVGKRGADAAGWQHVAAENAAAFTLSISALALRTRAVGAPAGTRAVEAACADQ